MGKDRNELELSIIKSLREIGEVIPHNLDELEHYEKNYLKDDIPEMPDSLKNAEDIIARGYVTKEYPTEVNSPITDNMARAAREGKQLPQDILDKMKKDRNDSND